MKGCHGFIKHYRDVAPNSCFCHHRHHKWRLQMAHLKLVRCMVNSHSILSSFKLRYHRTLWAKTEKTELENRKKTVAICKTVLSQWKTSKRVVPCWVVHTWPLTFTLNSVPKLQLAPSPPTHWSNFSISQKVFVSKLFPQGGDVFINPVNTDFLLPEDRHQAHPLGKDPKEFCSKCN